MLLEKLREEQQKLDQANSAVSPANGGANDNAPPPKREPFRVIKSEQEPIVTVAINSEVDVCNLCYMFLNRVALYSEEGDVVHMSMFHYLIDLIFSALL